MFEKFKLRVAVRQAITLGAVLIFLLACIYVVNLYQISKDIDSNLAMVSKYNRFDVMEESFIVEKDYDNKDSLAIFCDKNGKCYVNNDKIYPAETLEKILLLVNDQEIEVSGKGEGKSKVNGNNIAYSYEDMRIGRIIYVYDYTKEAKSMKIYAINLLTIAFVGMIGIVLYSFRYAQHSVESIETAFNKQQELVANASHELKTPLTVISTNLSILNEGRGEFSDEQQRWLDSINSQVGRMNTLVTEMLDLAKLDNEIEKQIHSDVEFGKLAEGIILEMEGVAFDKRIIIETDIDSDAVIFGSEKALEKLIYILIDNAIKYTNENGTINFSLKSEKRRTTLRVRNTGAGIDPEVLPKLFDRFYRVDESHPTTNSFGLGLSIAKSIVDGHKGTITASSEPNEYAEFCVVFNK